MAAKVKEKKIFEMMKEVRLWTPLQELNLKYRKVHDNILQIGENIFLIIVDHDENHEISPVGPCITAFCWGESLGAVARVKFMEIEKDKITNIEPPSFLLLDENAITYDSINRAGKKGNNIFESASYRFMDGEWVAQCVAIDNINYYFRKIDPPKGDKPFVISLQLEV